jgi:hypothetical protein
MPNLAVSGAVTASSFSGSGAGLTGVTSTGLNCAGCVANAQLGVNYALSASKGGPAANALALNGQPSTFYATTGSNTFIGAQTMKGRRRRDNNNRRRDPVRNEHGRRHRGRRDDVQYKRERGRRPIQQQRWRQYPAGDRAPA